MLTVEEVGKFGKVEQWLLSAAKFDATPQVQSLGARMKSELSSATPVDTGLTANSWNYTVKKGTGGVRLTVGNSSENGFNVVQALRHGHGTGTGGYVPPNDFVTPVVEPLIDNATNLIVRRVIA